MKYSELLTLHATVSEQNISIPSERANEDYPFIAIEIKAVPRYGIFEGQSIDFQVSLLGPDEPSRPVPGALFNAKTTPVFVTKAEKIRFDYLVPLVATRSIKELYLSFEKPKYGKAIIVAWQLSTSHEDL